MIREEPAQYFGFEARSQLKKWKCTVHLGPTVSLETLFLGEESLTVSHQDQGALCFGLAVVDLDSVRALAGPGELVHCHLDDACGHVVADLVSLKARGRDLYRVYDTPRDEIPHWIINSSNYGDITLYPWFAGLPPAWRHKIIHVSGLISWVIVPPGAQWPLFFADWWPIFMKVRKLY